MGDMHVAMNQIDQASALRGGNYAASIREALAACTPMTTYVQSDFAIDDPAEVTTP